MSSSILTRIFGDARWSTVFVSLVALLGCSTSSVTEEPPLPERQGKLQINDCPNAFEFVVENVSLSDDEALSINISVSNYSRLPFFYDTPSRQILKVYAYRPDGPEEDLVYTMAAPSTSELESINETSLLAPNATQLSTVSYKISDVIGLDNITIEQGQFPQEWVLYIEFWPRLMANEFRFPPTLMGAYDFLSYDCGFDGFVDFPSVSSKFRYLIADQGSVRGK